MCNLYREVYSDIIPSTLKEPKYIYLVRYIDGSIDYIVGPNKRAALKEWYGEKAINSTIARLKFGIKSATKVDIKQLKEIDQIEKKNGKLEGHDWICVLDCDPYNEDQRYFICYSKTLREIVKLSSEGIIMPTILEAKSSKGGIKRLRPKVKYG